jgi:hypothetical protein
MVVVLLASVVVLGSSGDHPAAAGTTGGRTTDPTLAYDAAGSRWLSLGSGEDLSSPSATMCTPVDPTIQSRGWVNAPIRSGPTPDRLRGCWEGDALLNGPGPWAVNGNGSVKSPSLLKVGSVWWLAYSATDISSGHRCIGIGASNVPTGPSWLQVGSGICAAAGADATDPELYYNPGNATLYLLWVETTLSSGRECGAQVKIQAINQANGTRMGTEMPLLDPTDPNLGFDETTDAQCPGGVHHRIGNPTMVRADNGTLWLLFSANDRTTANDATGWAVCGTGLPGAQTCLVLNAFDPVQPARYRPAWGSSSRTAPGTGSALPYFRFPDLGGFGSVSLAVANPESTSPQPVYATAEQVGTVPQQLTYRLDRTQVTPALYETETVAVHGAAGTFGDIATAAPAGFSQSGQSIATRAVPGFAWTPGYEGLFDAAADGKSFVAGADQNRYFPIPTANGMTIGQYDPGASSWTNIPIKWNHLSNKTTTGTTTLPPVDPADYTPTLPWEAASAPGAPHGDTVRQVGAPIGDVEPIANGNAIAFVSPMGYPGAYAYLNGANIPVPASGADGVWPTFGILTKVNNTWQVASGSGWVNQWTGGQLAASNPTIGAQACPSTTNHTFGAPMTVPPGESWCRGANELAVLPVAQAGGAQDIVVTQYGGITQDGLGGVMILRVTPQAGGRYDVALRASYLFPWMPRPGSTTPGDNIVLAPKIVNVDPTGQGNDQRFVVEFDAFGDTNGNAADIEGGFEPTSFVEFSYNASAATIAPVSAPVLTRPEPGRRLVGMSSMYDSDGNLWVYTGVRPDPSDPTDIHGPDAQHLGVFMKSAGHHTYNTAACGFDPATPLYDLKTVEPVNNNSNPAKTEVLWGKPCQPDDEILQGQAIGPRPPGQGLTMMMTEDPATKTMIVHDHWIRGSLAIRRVVSGSTTNFQVGDPLDAAEGQFVPPGETRPGVFDKNGRYWFTVAPAAPHTRTCVYSPFSSSSPLCPGAVAPEQATTHWQTSVDVGRLFDPQAMTLPATAQDAAVMVQAEATATVGTTVGTAQNGTTPVAAATPMQRCRDVPHPEFQGCPGWELLLGSAASGPVDYKVWVPVAGDYRLDYRVRGSGTIQASVVGVTGTYSTAVTNPAVADPGVTTSSPTIHLATGLQTLRLNATGGSWVLNWFKVTRL